MRETAALRLAIVPGLGDSDPGHWQSWLQAQAPGSVRVRQRDWHAADLERWSARIATTLEQAGPGPWLLVAHSFGCLAAAHWLSRLPPDAGPQVRGVLLVAPAEPAKFGVADRLPQQSLPVPGTLVGSHTDPWMSAASAASWARRWGCRWVDLGDAGHINVAAGFGTLPLARRWVQAMAQREARARRPRLAGVAEWAFAV